MINIASPNYSVSLIPSYSLYPKWLLHLPYYRPCSRSLLELFFVPATFSTDLSLFCPVISHILRWLMLLSTYDRFVLSRVRAWGLEMSGSRNTDMKETWIQDSTRWESQWMLNTEFAHINFLYAFIPQRKERGKKVKNVLTWHKGQGEQLLASIPETPSHYFLSKAFWCFGQGMQLIYQVS